MGLGQILSYATHRIKPNQIRIRKRELDASNNRSFASEFVSSDYEVTGLIKTPSKPGHPSFRTQLLRYFGRELFMAENPL